MKRLSLVHAKPNEKLRIVEVLGGSNLESRLLGMGLHKSGTLIKLSHIGLRGPVVIKAGRSVLALGHGVAEKVIVEKE
ncbi:MAG: FeoA domain-containing protein [Candidatus Omnitrophica bacterium]|jgi:Fe2+ transport system protein FeoA|nr:FeoA domain-containing protein [Candidatus Omnitrophota bacterium]MDD3275355.1 FeoA domain-containing protein [Candidatus Omnitrophota bacterium]MDD5077418.1 FeoA domain-containing protein [Candidatus Omnitrophota bacterium]